MDMIPISEVVVSKRLRSLREDIVSQIVASFAEVGQLEPILVAEADGRLIAGLHRLEAAKRLNWVEIGAELVPDRTANFALLMEIDENLIRADLTPAERAAHQAERKRIYELEYPATRHGARSDSGPKSQLSRKVCDLTIAKIQHNLPRYTADAAKVQGVSERLVQVEAARGAAIPDVGRLAGTSLDKGIELDALVKLSAENRDRLIDKAVNGEKVSAKTEVKRVRREEKEKTLAEKAVKLSESSGRKLYGVIYADPPWRFEPYSRETGMDRAADNHYPTMLTDNLAFLAVPAANDCVLFLWATAPMLLDALRLMHKWGFKYKTHCVWIKDRIGTGYWFRNKHELLLVGTRGDIPAPVMGSQMPSAVENVVGVHSAKPSKFAEMIESMYPNAPKLEMFARSRRSGWDSWGNEVT